MVNQRGRHLHFLNAAVLPTLSWGPTMDFPEEIVAAREHARRSLHQRPIKVPPILTSRNKSWLIKLHLSSLNLAAKDCKEMVLFLKGNCILRQINLSHNRIKHVSGSLLFNALTTNSSVLDVDLTNNLLNGHSSASIIHLLLNNHMLRSFDL